MYLQCRVVKNQRSNPDVSFPAGFGLLQEKLGRASGGTREAHPVSTHLRFPDQVALDPHPHKESTA